MPELSPAATRRPVRYGRPVNPSPEPDELRRITALLLAAGQDASPRTISPLGGVTNRNFLVEVGEDQFVVRLPGTGTSRFIDRLAEAHNARAAALAGIGPDVLHADGGALVTSFLPGPALTAEALRADSGLRHEVGRLLSLVHHCPHPFRLRFDPVAEIERHRSVLPAVPLGTDALIEDVRGLRPARYLVPCHNDPWPPNIVAGPDGLQMVDWEYSAMGDPAWDLADLVVEAGLDQRQRSDVVSGYAPGPLDPALQARIDALQPVTDLLWGLWYLVREQDEDGNGDLGDTGRRRIARAAATWVAHS